MTKIRYIGLKDVKPDNVAGTGLTWTGHGDVQEVSNPTAVAKLLAHSMVWEEAADDSKAATKAPKAGKAADDSKAADKQA